MKALAITGSLLMLVAFIVSCQSEQQMDFNRYYAAGATVYQTRCQNCHGDKGQGLAGLMPPLTDTLFLKAYKTELTCIMQNGMKKGILINGKTYDGQMPAAKLSAMEMAQVITYVTNSFGNKQGVKDHAAIEADLKTCK
jgi:mono/diheme cytochrome c family protein